MKRIIVHTEKIDRTGKKIMFQIKLPTNVTDVKGIIVEASLKGTFGGTPANRHCGQLALSIPEKRDVFYSEDVFFSDEIIKEYKAIKVQGISADQTWMKSGKKRDFFKISVPIKRTIVEGFYQDQRPRSKQQYQLTIYLLLA